MKEIPPTTECNISGCINPTLSNARQFCLLHDSDESKPADKFASLLHQTISTLARGKSLVELKTVTFPAQEVHYPSGWFGSRVVFHDTVFRNTTLIIKNGVIDYDIAFRGGELRGRIVFDNCILASRISFGPFDGECSFDFSLLRFKPGARIDLSHAYMGICSFETHSIDDLRQHFIFHSTSWNRRGKWINRRVMLDEDTATCKQLVQKSEGPSRVASHLSREYGKLETLFEEQGEHSSAVAFHYSRMELWRLALYSRIRSRLDLLRRSAGSQDATAVKQIFEKKEEYSRLRFVADWFVLSVFKWTSGYNDRYARAAAWLAFILLSIWMSLFFGGVEYGGHEINYDLTLANAGLTTNGWSLFWEDAIVCTRLTLAHIVFRVPEAVHPTSLAGKLVSLLGLVLCPFFLALFVLSIRRVFRSARP